MIYHVVLILQVARMRMRSKRTCSLLATNESFSVTNDENYQTCLIFGLRVTNDENAVSVARTYFVDVTCHE